MYWIQLHGVKGFPLHRVSEINLHEPDQLCYIKIVGSLRQEISMLKVSVFI